MKALVEGREVTAHLSDTGRLRELLVPGASVLLSPNPRGKLDFKLTAVRSGGEWVFLMPSLHSKIARCLIKSGCLGFVPKEVKGEVTFGSSRIDFLVDGKLFVEVKGCNLVEGGVCLFPDAPTARGRKHLEELVKAKKRGFDAAILFLAFKSCFCIKANEKRDKDFAEALKEAVRSGVGVFGFLLSFNPQELEIEVKKTLSLCP